MQLLAEGFCITAHIADAAESLSAVWLTCAELCRQSPRLWSVRPASAPACTRPRCSLCSQLSAFCEPRSTPLVLVLLPSKRDPPSAVKLVVPSPHELAMHVLTTHPHLQLEATRRRQRQLLLQRCATHQTMLGRMLESGGSAVCTAAM